MTDHANWVLDLFTDPAYPEMATDTTVTFDSFPTASSGPSHHVTMSDTSVTPRQISPMPLQPRDRSVQPQVDNPTKMSLCSDMRPPPRKRAKKAPTMRVDAWKPYKKRIIDLHINQKKPLGEVQTIMDTQYGFTANERQYRTRLSQWGLDKNIKAKEMRIIVRKQQHRKLVEPDRNPLQFWVRGKLVEIEQIKGFMKRNSISDDCEYTTSSAAATPSTIECHTIAECDSPTAIDSQFSTTPSQTAQSNDPAEEVQDVPSCEASTSEAVDDTMFTGQSPAPCPVFPFDPSTHSLANSHTAVMRAFLQPVSQVFHDIVYSQPTYSIPGLLEELKAGSTSELGPQVQSVQSIDGPVNEVGGSRFMKSREKVLRLELHKLETTLGRDHVSNLDTLLHLSYLLGQQGRYEAAEALIRHCLTICSHHKSEAEPYISRVSCGLGRVLAYQGQYATAEVAMKECLEHNSRRLGLSPMDSSTLDYMHELAKIYLLMNRLDEAEEIITPVISESERLYGSDSAATMHSIALSADICQRQGKLAKAEELQCSLLYGCIKLFGSNYWLTFTTMARLASTYKLQNQLGLAENLNLRAFTLSKGVFGTEHPSTLHILSELGHVCMRLGRLDYAEKLHAYTLKACRKVLGSDHPFTLKSVRNLAAICLCFQTLDDNALSSWQS